MISGILDLAQIEAGKLFLPKEHLSPAKYVEESFHYCKSIATEKNISLSFDPAGLSDCLIDVDPIRLKQCLLNLISNGIKYNVDGGQVNVGFAIANNDIEIRVRDTGPGIPDDKHPYLFEMFNRLGAERSTIEGSGVGLVISKQLAVAMGGDLIYYDDDKPGACFKLYFPLLEKNSLPKSVLESGRDKNQAMLGLQFNDMKTVFYIEDNKSNIRLLHAWLASAPQLSIKSSTDPLLGLYQMRRARPDIILLDINMPGMNGYDLLRVIRQDASLKYLSVIALSASAMEADVERGLAMGFDAYLTKPLDINKLSAVFNCFFSNESLAGHS